MTDDSTAGPHAESRSPLAIGWATVELDRAARELAPRLAAGAAFEPAAPCAHLGAICRVGRLGPGDPGPAFLVLLEPATEGRLAATLARHGEGWCATWAAEPTTPAVLGSSERQSVRLDGPLGPERLVLGGPVDGPHRLLVTAATIAP